MINPDPKTSQYGVWLIYAANLILFLTLLLARSSRIAESSTPYITVQFIGLMFGALVLTGVSTRLAHSGSLWNWLHTPKRWQTVILWIAGSYTTLVIAGGLLTFLSPYLLPFVLWLTLLNLGLVILTLTAKSGESPEIKVSPTVLRRWMRTGALVILWIAVPLLVLEIGLRLWFTFFGTPYEKAIYTYSAEEIARTQSNFMGSPYINFGLAPNRASHNSLGYRGPEITLPKPDGVFRIVCMGGSTTYGISLNWTEAYPAQLEKILREEYGYTKVEVINAGVMAYTSWDTLVNFEFRVLDIQPDMIIVYDGINDVVARLVDPKYYTGLNPARGIWNTHPEPLSPSVLYRYIAINAGWIPNPGTLDWQLRTDSPVKRCTGRDFCDNLNMTPQQVLEANPPIYFERNLRNLAALAKANGVQAVFSSWAYFPDDMGAGIDPFMTYPHVQQAADQQNAILKQLADDTSAAFYDLAGSMAYNKAFWFDGMHLTAAGTHEQAALYAAFLVENNLLPETARGS